MSPVIRQHSGRFHAGRNLQEFVSGVNSFFAFNYSELGLRSEEELIQYVWTIGIVEPTSIFLKDKVQVLDALDQQTGTQYIAVCSATWLELLSSLLKWRTVDNILLCSDLTRVLLANLQMEVQNGDLPVVVASLSNVTRTVEFQSKPPPLLSSSMEIHPPSGRSNKHRRRTRKTPRAKNSATCSLPGEASCCLIIMEHYKMVGKGWGVSPSFNGCNAVFCPTARPK